MPYDPARHGPRRLVGPGFHAQVHDLVRSLPPGCVVTYGDIGASLGSKNVARHVGYAMAAVPAGSDVPWWRVVAANGRVARAGTAMAREQQRRLRTEGIATKNGRVVDFLRHRFPLAAP